MRPGAVERRRGVNHSAARWDARYRAAEGGLFGDAPSEYLRMVQARSDVAIADALFPADGDGRNGCWLAEQGVRVTAVDLSAEAAQKAQARDLAARVSVERLVADLKDWSPLGGRRWQGVMVFHLHGPSALRRRVARAATEWLAPGGWFALEGFAKGQAGGAMGPEDPDKLWSLDELTEWTAGLEAVEAFDGAVRLAEGPRHRGMARVTRFLARKPAA